MVAALRAVDGSTGCIGMVGAVKRLWIVHGVHGGDPRASRSALTSDEAARVGRRCGPPGAIGGTAAHAAELSAATRRGRKEGPLSSMR
jgi:hypothetical protein